MCLPNKPIKSREFEMLNNTIGPFIREKIRRVLDKTRTARINGTKQAFASYLRRVSAKTRLIFSRINGPNILISFVLILECTHLLLSLSEMVVFKCWTVVNFQLN